MHKLSLLAFGMTLGCSSVGTGTLGGGTMTIAVDVDGEERSVTFDGGLIPEAEMDAWEPGSYEDPVDCGGGPVAIYTFGWDNFDVFLPPAQAREWLVDAVGLSWSPSGESCSGGIELSFYDDAVYMEGLEGWRLEIPPVESFSRRKLEDGVFEGVLEGGEVPHDIRIELNFDIETERGVGAWESKGFGAYPSGI